MKCSLHQEPASTPTPQSSLQLGRGRSLDFATVELIDFCGGYVRFYDREPEGIDCVEVWNLKGEMQRRLGVDVIKIGKGVYVNCRRIWCIYLGMKVVEFDSGGSADVEIKPYCYFVEMLAQLGITNLIEHEG